MTFSSDADTFPRRIATFGNDGKGVLVGDALKNGIESNGFLINAKKLRLRRSRDSQEVTGLVVNERLNVRRTLTRQVRSMLHAWEKFGLEQAQHEYATRYARGHRHPRKGPLDFPQIVRGKIEFVGLVRGREDRLYCRLLGALARLLPDAEIKVPTPVNDNPLLRMLDDALFVLEGLRDNPGRPPTVKQGTAFLLEGVGLVTCGHVLIFNATEAFRPQAPRVRFPVSVLVKDDERDLAVLSLPEEALVGTSPLRRAAGPLLRTGVSINVTGFPGHREGDSVALKPGTVVQVRADGPERRFSVSAPIVAGMSGGPVLRGTSVVGVAVTGADSDGEIDYREHGIIPIDAIDRLGLP